MLQCEHQFCFGCLSEYLKSPDARTCPICREPVDSVNGPPRDRPAQERATDVPFRRDPDNSDGSTQCGANRSNTAFSPLRTVRNYAHREAEYQYRLRRMHQLYPEVLPTSSYSALSQAAQNGPQALRQAIQQRSSEVTSMIND